MAEADVELEPTVSTATDSLLEGLATGDLSTGVYEGGFKTWECAVDLAGFVASRAESVNEEGGEWHVIELGAGSAISSLVLLKGLLRERREGEETWTGEEGRGRSRRVRFTLCDYNEEVLRLCTAVNVFLTVLGVADATTGNGEVIDNEGQSAEEGHVEVEQGFAQRALRVLGDANIEVEFISGAWGDAFLSLLYPQRESANVALDAKLGNSRTLVLASETIYSPDSLGPFSRLLVEIIENERRMKTETTEILVAAKKVYFGVGGGVAEFEEEMRTLGGRTRTVLDVEGVGVRRVVLEVLAN